MTGRPEVPAGFGLALYRLREARRWSLRRAAREAGVSVTTVMRAEQGHSVQLGPAIRLAGAYGTTVGALLDGTEGPDVSSSLAARKEDTMTETSAGAGIAMIATERARQVAVEGYTPEHDAEHGSGELARAGAVYALRAVNAGGVNPYDPMRYWPGDWLFKPGEPLDSLVKAGALIAAEIDRIVATETQGGARCSRN